MILGFKPQFKLPIRKGIKIHSFREDKTDRWQEGMTIHMATGVRTKNYKQFHEAKVVCIQRATIYPQQMRIAIVSDAGHERFLGELAIERFAKNDGFKTPLELFDFFKTAVSGKIIHWTAYRY